MSGPAACAGGAAAGEALFAGESASESAGAADEPGPGNGGAGLPLPGYGDTVPCWKCRGAGKTKVGGRRAKRAKTDAAPAEAATVEAAPEAATPEAAPATAACAVCGGAGSFPRRARSTAPGKVTPGRSSEAEGPRPVGGWRIFQNVKGHRYSTEDVVTAHVASGLLQGRVRHYDLGCGIGSVLMMVAWRASKENRIHFGTGIEAQPDSFKLARRSIAFNGANCQVLEKDLRAFSGVEEQLDPSTFGLVTGTPPYFNVSTNGPAKTTNGALPRCEESAGARYEFRGGMEEYCQAGARCLATFEEQNIPSKFVCCEGGLQVNLERVALAAGAAGLVIERHLPVVGREGKPPLFGVWVFSKRENAAQRHAEPDVALVVRDLAGARTPEYLRLLGEMGMTP